MTRKVKSLSGEIEELKLMVRGLELTVQIMLVVILCVHV
jgi:hypothetical protein